MTHPFHKASHTPPDNSRKVIVLQSKQTKPQEVTLLARGYKIVVSGQKDGLIFISV